MRVRSSLNLLTVLAALACVQWTALAHCAAQDASPLCTVSGVVKNRLTGQPIERALVDGQSDAALTDSEGRFELRLNCGFAQLQVRRPGYAGASRGQAVTARVTAEMPALTLYLTPLAGIAGHVTVANGGDPESVHFTAYRKRLLNGHERWEQAAFATADSDGNFRMYELEAPADYVLCSRAMEERLGRRVQGAPRWGYPSVCYPAAPGDADANLLHLAAGRQADAEIVLTRQPFHIVNLTEQNLPPGQGMSIEIHDRSGFPAAFPVNFNQERKTVEAELPNGTYYADARIWGETMSYGRVDFKVADAPPSGLSLVLLPLAPLEVRVRTEFTAKAAPAVGGDADQNVLRGLNLVLTPADGMMQNGGGGNLRHPEGADNSYFELVNVVPGRYWVQASFFTGGYVASMTSGGVDLTREPLVVGPGSSAQPIEVTLRNDTGEIDCTLGDTGSNRAADDGGAMNGTVVYAIPAVAGGAPWPRAGVLSGARGQITNLAPGGYRVVALPGSVDLDAMDPPEFASIVAQGKPVTVGAGATVNIQVDPIDPDGEAQNP